MNAQDTLPQWTAAKCRRVIAAYDNKLCGEITPYDDKLFKHAWARLDVIEAEKKVEQEAQPRELAKEGGAA